MYSMLFAICIDAICIDGRWEKGNGYEIEMNGSNTDLEHYQFLFEFLFAFFISS